jgi:cell division transport system permease protein
MTTGAVAVSVLLLALVYLGFTNVDAVSQNWGQGVEMVVYLEDGVSPERVEEISGALQGIEAVTEVQYVSSSAARSRLMDSMGKHRDVLEGIEDEMLPASLEVSLGAGVRDVITAHPIIEKLRRADGVEEVDFLGQWVGKLTSMVWGLKAASAFLLLLVALACVYVVSTTIRLRVEKDSGRSSLLKLMGASDAYLRGPVLVEGSLLGFLGASLALLGLWVLFRTSAPGIEAVLSNTFGSTTLSFLGTLDLVIMVIGAAALGFVGSLWATGSHETA